ncbi:MAG: antitermination protein NusG [Halobacteriovoraceae bacterium]|nr:antitermination protein NusG [Halobacteriovoraceae bacterium]
MEILSWGGAEIFGRWVHYFAGVAWIGMLWFFNFVQGGWFKTTDADTKNNAVKEMVPNALWWFRFGALWTWISGMYLLWHRADYLGMANLGNSSWTVWILLGSLMGTFMFLNVWLIIWPAQKIIIGKANGQDLGDAAAAAARAGVASRTNTLFSIPLLFMMGAASHFTISVRETGIWPAFLVCAALIVLIEINAAFGPKKMGPMASVKGVVTSGCVLLLVQYLIVDLMCK